MTGKYSNQCHFKHYNESDIFTELQCVCTAFPLKKLFPSISNLGFSNNNKFNPLTEITKEIRQPLKKSN